MRATDSALQCGHSHMDSAKEAASRELADYVFERDRHEFSLGDILDIKTGLILASLTFLALQSGSLIDGKLSLLQTLMQSASILALVAGGLLSAIELWPRSYYREAMPAKYEEWLAEIERFNEQHPDINLETFHSVRLAKAKDRVRINGAINRTKSTLMFWAFLCLIASFGANLATLATRLF